MIEICNSILNRLKHELPLPILKTIYNTLFLSHLNYEILLWGSEIESIHKLQKRVLRIISGGNGANLQRRATSKS